MTTETSFHGIPAPDGTDPVKNGDDAMRALAERVDYLLGEAGETSITPSAATTKTTKTINFGRTYKNPPRVVISFGHSTSGAAVANGAASIWVESVSTTQLVIGIYAANTNSRDLTWIAKPRRGDVTP